jgi:hypothetical protein
MTMLRGPHESLPGMSVTGAPLSSEASLDRDTVTARLRAVVRDHLRDIERRVGRDAVFVLLPDNSPHRADYAYDLKAT